APNPIAASRSWQPPPAHRPLLVATPLHPHKMNNWDPASAADDGGSSEIAFEVKVTGTPGSHRFAWNCCHALGAHCRPCVKALSAGLPQLDPIALRIGDPAESTDPLHILSLLGHVRSLGVQLREHRIQVADPEVE